MILIILMMTRAGAYFLGGAVVVVVVEGESRRRWRRRCAVVEESPTQMHRSSRGGMRAHGDGRRRGRHHKEYGGGGDKTRKENRAKYDGVEGEESTRRTGGVGTDPPTSNSAVVWAKHDHCAVAALLEGAYVWCGVAKVDFVRRHHRGVPLRERHRRVGGVWFISGRSDDRGGTTHLVLFGVGAWRAKKAKDSSGGRRDDKTLGGGRLQSVKIEATNMRRRGYRGPPPPKSRGPSAPASKMPSKVCSPIDAGDAGPKWWCEPIGGGGGPMPPP
mmetsp:Transcript_14539/g.58009  ORF Transcript_14539/g.58009 Transcript_14539/m.58009 type:complete len:273 (-) Transcript_14539:440-1258(-)